MIVNQSQKLYQIIGLILNYQNNMRNKIEELIKLYHTDSEFICKGNAASYKLLPLDKLIENRRMAKEKLLELSKEQLVSYILNKNEVPNDLMWIYIMIDGKYYVDGEKVIYVKSKDDFIRIIKSVCGVEESNRIEVACMEYGIPFLYDRTKKLLKQVPSKSLDRNMDLSEKQVLKSIANEKQNQTTEIDSVFQAVLANRLY